MLGDSGPPIHKRRIHMSLAIQAPTPQSASLALSILQSKAGNRWGRAVEEMKTKRLHVAGDFPEFVVTNKNGTGYKVRLDPHGNGTCTCPISKCALRRKGGFASTLLRRRSWPWLRRFNLHRQETETGPL